MVPGPGGEGPDLLRFVYSWQGTGCLVPGGSGLAGSGWRLPSLMYVTGELSRSLGLSVLADLVRGTTAIAARRGSRRPAVAWRAPPGSRAKGGRRALVLLARGVAVFSFLSVSFSDEAHRDHRVSPRHGPLRGGGERRAGLSLGRVGAWLGWSGISLSPRCLALPTSPSRCLLAHGKSCSLT